MKKRFRSENSYALVTGASSGMGREYARLLAADGYNLILVALVQEEMDAVAAELRLGHPSIDIVSIGMDLSGKDAPWQIFEAAAGKTVDVLINNAGIIDIKHFRDIPEQRVSSIIMIHNHALAVLTRLFLPLMLERGGGYILNVSSISAWMPYPFITVYSATKAFVKVFTKALRTECRGSGVKVATVYFGAVSTSLYDLKDKYRRLALRSGIMISPDKAARRALRMLFAGRSGAVPGVVNGIAIALSPLMPPWLAAALNMKVTAVIGDEHKKQEIH